MVSLAQPHGGPCRALNRPDLDLGYFNFTADA